jgi:hypothetical protein
MSLRSALETNQKPKKKKKNLIFVLSTGYNDILDMSGLIKHSFKINLMCLGTVVHACNYSYLEGKVWEDHSLRGAWAKSYQEPISINK